MEAFKPHDHCNHFNNNNALAPQLDLEVNLDRFLLFIFREIRIQLLSQQTVQRQHTHADSHRTQSKLPQSNCIVHHSGE